MKKYKFKAEIESESGGGACILFPTTPKGIRHQKAACPCRAAFDGNPYTGSLIKYGHPQHMLGLLKAIREQIGKQSGDTINVELWKDEAPRTVEVPAAFAAAMKKADVLAAFEKLSYARNTAA